MSVALLYWLIVLFWVLASLWGNWPLTRAHAPNVILLILFLIIGWLLFGAPVHK